MNYVLGSRAAIGGVLGRGGAAAAGGLPVAGAVLWLDASQITGLSDGAAITTWPDMSGNGYNATQTGASTLKPTYKTGIANGKPIARFDGGDFLVLGVPVGINFAPTDGYSLFVVAKSTASIGYIISKFNSTQASPFAALWDNTTIYGGFPYSTNATGGTRSNPGGFSIASIVTPATSGNGALRVNGGASASLTRGSTDITANGIDFLVGARRSTANTGSATYFNGDMAEIIIYASALSDANRQAIEAYLAAKYAIL